MSAPDVTWRKGSRSNGTAECVEVADVRHTSIAVRDSKTPDAGHLRFTLDTWAAFVAEVRGGRYDLS